MIALLLMAAVEVFTPQGTVKDVRQVQARFAEQMVPFGDLRPKEDPFIITCPVPGVGRWVDGRTWVYDFGKNLPAGVKCEFRLRDGEGTYSFSTGGPAVLQSRPFEGATVEEQQAFILQLDAEPTEDSVLSSVYFTVEGISERIPVRILAGDERTNLIESQYPNPRYRPQYLIIIQARRTFPHGKEISLVWGRGVRSRSGVATEQDQALPFEVRVPFTATFHCNRVNAQSDCIPILPLRLSFSAPVLWSDVKSSVLKGPGGQRWLPKENRAAPAPEHVSGLVFDGPFPEKETFTLEIPTGIEDDAGRPLDNAGGFPLTVRTDEYPPLAKFAANFGILELKGKPMLPVTLRNVEPEIAARMLEVSGGEGSVDPPDEEEQKRQQLLELSGRMGGRVLRVPSDKPGQMMWWIDKVGRRTWDDRDKSVFGPVTSPNTRRFSIPKLHGSKPFEVVGIPMSGPGFYVVEIESEILGAALLGQPKPMYVPTTVLATNLAVHFKRGIERSLVWVTTLDKARPAAGAAVQVQDCSGKILWQGRTDRNGIARPTGLPAPDQEARCGYETGLLVAAQLGEDMAFVHTSWVDGIENWRFRLPTEYDYRLLTGHTIFDRPLFRAGETVRMKHVLRRHATSGFALAPEAATPDTLVIEHLGSDQSYRIPLKWDAAGIAETSWAIPKEARLGRYEVSLETAGKSTRSLERTGSFRVQEFRVPLMRGFIRPPSEPQVAPAAVPLDLTVLFLSGGPAGNLPVQFRYDVQRGALPSFEGFEGFVFSNGRVVEGLVRSHEAAENESRFELKSTPLTLDAEGSARTVVKDLPKVEVPHDLLSELEFRDPNGEVQTVSSRIPLFPADRHVGIRPASWVLARESLEFQAAVADLAGNPLTGAQVRVDLLQRITYSHRKRLVGGFYAYEHSVETRRVQPLCDGKTDAKGTMRCEAKSPVSGNVILQATAFDSAGREITAHSEVWISGDEDWWFQAEDSDRIDVIPERNRYEPGEKAKFQVRMPFRNATALVTVEREGVADAFLRDLSGREPVIEIPVRGSFAPNTFISVLVVRGRTGGVRPTATVDLGRPAHKLGIAQITVGWKAHELRVSVKPDRTVYKVREKAKVAISVRTADTSSPPANGEAAVAAVDEGLLELMPNESWQILESMMGRRGLGVQTSTAQMHVIGKRHFGLKALPQGGGGGRQSTRELFDTLLLWQGRVRLDAKGEALIEVPLNDSITSFRIVAVATAGVDRFGSGSASIRSTQDLMIFSGISPVVRTGDRIRSEFTLRNAGQRPMNLRVSARVDPLKEPLPGLQETLEPGQSKTIGWNLRVPSSIENLRYEVEAAAEDGARDSLAVNQRVVPSVPARTYQATIAQLEKEIRMEVERPADALPGPGGVEVTFQRSLLHGLSGVTEYMAAYPYSCLEQNISRAIALRDTSLWRALMAHLPAFLDGEGLAKYFPTMRFGSEVLTSYILALAREAGWEIPGDPLARMIQGLRGFVEGRVVRYSSLPTADLSIRKLSAVEALSRYESVDPGLLSSIPIEPNLWPTSAVIDWANILARVPVRNRGQRAQEAQQILRSRLDLQGTTMGFSTESSDRLWWLMVSTDVNAVRLLLTCMESPAWKEDIPRLVRGALGRQRRGRWDTTVANAWGILAMEKFSRIFEKEPVTGVSTARLDGKTATVDWKSNAEGGKLALPWPEGRAVLELGGTGSGRPWVTARSVAAVPLKEPLFSGFHIKRTVSPVQQRKPGVWSQGDIARIRLELEAQSDMTWVVVQDPIPAGAAIFGTGLGRDSALATQLEERKGSVWPAFEERSFEAFRAYYEYVPKGTWVVEYTMRLNNEGLMNLPPTRVEALYAPEMFGELPNGPMQVRQ